LSQIAAFDAPLHFEKLYHQMCQALEHFHRQGYLYADLKPSNICIDTDGNFILIDIGSVVKIGSSEENIHTTEYYLPLALKITKALPIIDFFMLGFTMLSMLIGVEKYDELIPRVKSMLFEKLKERPDLINPGIVADLRQKLQ
jgi:serine/threonine protein kinase